MSREIQIEKLEIMNAEVKDISVLQDIAHVIRSEKEPNYFDLSIEAQGKGLREVLVARYEGEALGYCMLLWEPKYGFYRTLGIPEIQDLNVKPAFRKEGVATALIQHCEGLAVKKGCEMIGIGFGLYSAYGAAQRLYVKLGYVPDGNGVTYDRVNVHAGEVRPIDDDLSLMLVKDLKPAL